MKVLFTASPVIGHVSPLLVAARVLQNAGHETALYTGTHFREKIESARLKFFPLPADVDVVKVAAAMTPGHVRLGGPTPPGSL